MTYHPTSPTDPTPGRGPPLVPKPTTWKRIKPYVLMAIVTVGLALSFLAGNQTTDILGVLP